MRWMTCAEAATVRAVCTSLTVTARWVRSGMNDAFSKWRGSERLGGAEQPA